MVIEGLNSEIFFDLIKGLIDFSTEENLLKKNLPNFLRKLNCYCCFVNRIENEVEEVIYTLPFVMKKDKRLGIIKKQLLNSSLKENRFKEISFEGSFYYYFELRAYGSIVFGRKKRFHTMVLNELTNIMGIYAKVLLHSQEIKKEEESRAQLDRERNLLLTIIDNIPVHVIARDEKNQIIINNEKALKGEKGFSPSNILSFFDNKDVDADDIIIEEFSDKELMLNLSEDKKKWGLYSLLPLIDVEGSCFGHIGLGIDITSQKTKEIYLKAQKEQYWNIISNANFGIFELNRQEELVFCNSQFEEMSGYTKEELIGRDFKALFFPRLSSSQKRKAEVNWCSKNNESKEVLIHMKNGDPQWWLLSISGNLSQEGKKAGFICICVNISNQKLMDAELKFALKKSQDSSNSKALFLANMSHEIRTPLNGIIGAIRVLESVKFSTYHKPYFDSLSNASTHLLSLINNVLDITKIESKELLLNNRDFKLSDVLQSLESILKPQAEQKKIELSINLNLGMPDLFHGDATRLRQVLLNVGGNAVKFTEHGYVRLLCSYNTDLEFLEIRVIDTGIGMEETYLDKIFEKFQQENDSTSRKNGGTGLGLYISKCLLDIMGGRIKVRSQKSQGTQFDLQIPIKLGREGKSRKTDIYENLETLCLENILLVEDNEMNRLVAKHTLRKIGAGIYTAENGEEAVRILSDGKVNIDLILMDIQMPILDGKKATKIIRQKLKLDIPIIALSAHAIKTEIEECKKIGFNDYLTKPFEEEDLFRLIYKTMVSSVNDNTQMGKMGASKFRPTASLDAENSYKYTDFNFLLEEFKLRIPSLIQGMEASFRIEDWDSFINYSRELKRHIREFGMHHLKNDLDYFEMIGDCQSKDLFVVNMKLNNVKINLERVLTNID